MKSHGDKTELSHFLSDLKNENDPIVIEYDPENSRNIILRQFGIIE
jgi:hypothetical protein